MKKSEPKPAAWKLLFRFAQAALFTVIEVFAARALDGWLSWAVWSIAIWNVAMILTLLVGLSILSANAMKEAA